MVSFAKQEPRPAESWWAVVGWNGDPMNPSVSAFAFVLGSNDIEVTMKFSEMWRDAGLPTSEPLHINYSPGGPYRVPKLEYRGRLIVGGERIELCRLGKENPDAYIAKVYEGNHA